MTFIAVASTETNAIALALSAHTEPGNPKVKLTATNNRHEITMNINDIIVEGDTVTCPATMKNTRTDNLEEAVTLTFSKEVITKK